MTGIAGRTYLERGELVEVIAQWRGHGAKAEFAGSDRAWDRPPWIVEVRPRRYPVRNVLIRRADGSLAVRPFRGLRVPR